MASEAVVFPQEPLGNGDGGWWNFIYDGFGGQEEKPVDDGVVNYGEWDVGLSPVAATEHGGGGEEKAEVVASETVGRKKRRRSSSTKSCKNKEEVENRRKTHIVVERNRRLLMNEYLTVLRSIMPQSYVQRGDQASIVGGAINLVKELEQLLQSLEAQRRLKKLTSTAHPADDTSTPFSDFSTSCQYSSTSAQCTSSTAPTSSDTANETIAKNHSAAADIEVTVAESHAKLKVLSRRRPNQLLKMVVDLQNLRLTTLHLNVTTVEQMVLYSFSLKVEDDCHLTAADDIATAVYELVGKIQEEAGVV